MSTTHLIRFAAIEQKLDTVLFRRPDEPEPEGGSVLGTAAKVAAAGGTAYGAFRADAAIRNRQGGMNAARAAGQPRTGYVGAARDLTKDVTAPLRAEYGALRSGVAGTGAGAFGRGGFVAGKGVFRSGLGALKKIIRAGAKPDERLILLAAVIEDAHEFDLNLTDHIARHYGGPLGVAATSRKGKKWDAFKDSSGEMVKRTGHDAAVGGAIGAAGGLAVGHFKKDAIAKLAHERFGDRAALSHLRGKTAAIGALGAGAAGLLVGSVRGTHGKRQRAIQEKYHA